MALADRPYASVEDVHAAELETLKVMWDLRIPIAVPAAMHYCAKHELDVPAWLRAESNKLLCSYLRDNRIKFGEGRSAGIKNRYKQDMVDYLRWDAVEEIREQRTLLQRDLAAIPTPSIPRLKKRIDKRIRHARNLLKEIGGKDDSVFKYASEMLDKTLAFGGPDAIKRSYYKVERHMRDPAKAKGYLVLDSDFLHQLNIDL